MPHLAPAQGANEARRRLQCDRARSRRNGGGGV